MRFLATVSATVLFAACSSGGDVTAPPTTGGLRVTATTTGHPPDPAVYYVRIADGDGVEIGANGSVSRAGLAPGAYAVRLYGIGSVTHDGGILGCNLSGTPDRIATVVAGQEITVAYTVECPGPTPGGPNHAPTISQPDTADRYTTTDQPVSSGLVAFAHDEDWDNLTVAIARAPANGTLTLHDDGTYTYEPRADFFGEDSFDWRAKDGTSESATATVRIRVNAIPVAKPDTIHAKPGETKVISSLLANDRNPDGDPVVVVPAFEDGAAIARVASDFDETALGDGAAFSMDAGADGLFFNVWNWNAHGGFTVMPGINAAPGTYTLLRYRVLEQKDGPHAASAAAKVVIVVDP